MKKIALLLLVAFQAINLQAQQTITFKIGYKPNTTYKQTQDQTTKNTISYGSDMEPMEQESSLKLNSIITTGKVTSTGIIPITMQMSADKDSDVAAIMPEGATIYGIVKQDGMPQFDSINAKGMPAETKAVMMSTMKAVASQSLISERKVKVGETFTIDTPLEMPMGPATMIMNTKTTYKLNKVEGRKAFFDMSMVINTNGNIQGQEIKGSGVGTGTLVYDIDNNYFLENNLKSNMKMDIDAQGMKMEIGVGQESKMSTVITANK